MAEPPPNGLQVTVSELIAELQKLSPETPVWVEGDGYIYSPQVSEDQKWDNADGWRKIALISPGAQSTVVPR